jgi:hypothetical protein
MQRVRDNKKIFKIKTHRLEPIKIIIIIEI